MRTSDAGFTLFEVLGAVAILAIVYTTLSTVAIRGLRSEGESQRMLEASMLADWELSEFELDLRTGAAPEIGTTEDTDEDGYTTIWEISPLETPIFENAPQKDPNAGTPNASAPNASAPNPVVPTAPTTLTQEGVAPFLQVVLRVTWLEAGAERSVTRTLFAVDEDAAAKFAAEGVLNQIPVEGEGEQP